MSPLPPYARAIVVGGGIVGASAAYHLAKAGWNDVLLLEQNRIGGGTTWHAAGMVTRLRPTQSMAIINELSAKLYASLPDETGVQTGWRQCGSLLLARKRDRVTQLRRTARMAKLFGVDCHELAPEEATSYWPTMATDDLVGAFFVPEDGLVEPASVAVALAKGAEQSGATIREGVRVTALLRHGARASGVRTSHGDVQAEVVVLCGGIWTRGFGLDHGIDLSLYPVEHHYVQTKPIDGVTGDEPCTRDYDGATYFRPVAGGVRFGAFQAKTKPWTVDRVPADFSFRLFDPDWERFKPSMKQAWRRLPFLEQAEIEHFVNGPESFTPDGAFLLGPVPAWDGLFVGAGFNSFGIAGGGGAGWALAEWITTEEAPFDLWPVDPRRFGPALNNAAFLRERVPEVLGQLYAIAWPGFEYTAGRDLRHSPVHAGTVSRGACFGQRYGWERPLWFSRDGSPPRPHYSFGRPAWFEAWADEHVAARERVALFDQSSFGKYLVTGRDACVLLNWVCGNRIDVEPGRIVYTGMFNSRGTFESDLTVLRLDDDRFYVVTSAAQTLRDRDWIERQRRMRAMSAEIADVSAAWGVLGLMGPLARQLLQELSSTDLGNEAFPFGSARWIDVGRNRALAARITYVGELGWELHVPVDQTLAVFEQLVAAGKAHGLKLAGTVAQNSLRLEKSYVSWGHDVSTDDTPLEAGLGFAIAWDKPDGFLGLDALFGQREWGIRKRLVTFVLEDREALLWGGEPILRDGVSVGYTTSGAFGHTLGAGVGMGYVKASELVTPAWVMAGSYQIDVAGKLVPARATLRAPYDPERRWILS